VAFFQNTLKRVILYQKVSILIQQQLLLVRVVGVFACLVAMDLFLKRTVLHSRVQ
jgi:hypothetical protein